MKILFFTHYFPPEVNAPAKRTFEHALEWVRLGHDVTIVTNNPNHPDGVLIDGYKNNIFSREIVDGVTIIRLWTFLTPSAGFLKRILNYLVYFLLCVLNIFRYPKADVVIGTSPQFFCGLAALCVSKVRRIKFVLEIRDLWPESIVSVGALKNKNIVAILEWLEKLMYNQASLIIINSLPFKKHILKKVSDKMKAIEYVPNGINLEIWDKNLKSLCLKPVQFEFKGVHLAYIGTLGLAHGIETLLNVIVKFKNKDIFLHLIGSGSEKQIILSKVKAMGLNNVFIHGLIPFEQIPFIFDSVDISLIVLKNSDVFDTVIPSKIFDSMAAKVPIVAAVGAEATRLITEFKCGVCVEPENELAIFDAISKLINSRSVRRELGQNGYNNCRKYFNRRELAMKMLRRLEAV
jgi:glycosyltransferase involved in cell wall biosynthesis